MSSPAHGVALLVLCLAPSALGHGILVAPAPRNGANVAGNNKGNANTGACGEGNQETKGAPAGQYTAGQTISVEWDCTIPHGGECAISLDTTTVAQGDNDDGTYNVDGDGIITQHTLADKFPCCGNAGTDSRTVTIPADAACDNCVLQWWWDGDASYFDCSDITILASGGAGGVGALLAPSTFKTEHINSVGAVLGVAVLGGLLLLLAKRIKAFKADPESLFESYESGWPSAGAVKMRWLLLLLRVLCFGCCVAVPSFMAVQSMLIMVGMCVVMALKETWLLFTSSKRPERLQGGGMWKTLMVVDVLELALMGYGTFMTGAREYATWVVQSDQGESEDTQKQLYYGAILLGYLVVAALSYQIVHSFAMVGCCIGGDGLLDADDKEVAFLEKKSKKKKSKSSSKKSKKKSKGGSKKSKKAKKAALADTLDQV